MNRKLVVVTAAVLLIILAVLGYLKQFAGSNKTVPKTAPFPTIDPSSYVRPVGNSGVSYINVPIASFPATLPRYSVTTKESFSSFQKRLASAFKMAGVPQIIEGARGTHAVMTDGIKQLIVSDNPLSFSYTEATLSGKKATNDTAYYEQTTTSKLESLDLITGPLALSRPSYRFLAPRGTDPNVTSAAGATVAEIQYGVSVEGRPVYISDAASPVFFSRYDGTNELIQLNGYLLPSIHKEDKETELLPYDQALARLHSGQGVLSSVAPSGPTVEYLNAEEIKNIRVASAELGYFYAPGATSLIPVYIFRGVSSDSVTAGTVETTTIVSATP